MAGEPATALALANSEDFHTFSKGFRSSEELALLAHRWMLQRIEEPHFCDEAKDFCLRALDDHNWLYVGRLLAEPFVKKK